MFKQFFIVFVLALLVFGNSGCASLGAGQLKLMGKCFKVETAENETNACLTRGWRE